MSSDHRDELAHRQSVLHELESVKNTLHAVDGNIEGILSKSAAIDNDNDSNIPILEDVVSDQSASIAVAEASADEQLSLTNKYKTLSDSDLEKATARRTVDPGDEPRRQTPGERADLTLHLDQFVIDDELELDFDEDFDFCLEDIADGAAAPVAAVAGDRATAVARDLPPQEDSILPDIDRLNAELGVEPLASYASTLTHARNAAITPAPEPLDEGSPSTDTLANRDPSQPLPEPNSQLAPAADSTPTAIAGFGLSTTTRINLAATAAFAGPQIPSNTVPSSLRTEQLMELIEQAVAAQIPALQQSLLQQLAPLLCPDFPGDS
jgi:hypothetical protein